VLRSLTSRIVLVVVLPIVAAWLAMGLTLTVILGNLHADATKASLADIGQTLVVQFRSAVLDRDVRVLVNEVRDAVADTDISVQVLRADGTYADLGTAGGTATPVGAIAIPASAARGDTVTGAAAFSDGQTHLYAVTVLRPLNVTGPRAVVLSRPDRSRAAAIADLVRTLPLVVVLSAVVGLPLVLVLSRSVGGPLRRLADATADLPVRSGHDPLPLEGPTEVRELTARFNAMAGELMEARQRETELLADLRHDLRTPLTVIGGYAAALADGTATGPEAERAARTIGEEAARLGRLVDELGAVERLRHGVDGLRPEPLDAGDVVRSSAERFESAAAAAGIELAVLADDPTLPGPAAGGASESLAFLADRGAVERIMANLVANALAATPALGHIWLSATAGPSTAPGASTSIVLAVTDDGPGFPPGAASRVFERFFRADPARTGPGSGLGLAIVLELATAHGGTVHAENVAPHGARVSVVLPRVPPAR
jgi:two-component system OmpR family sensor kinase